MKRALSSFLATALLLGQTVFPPAHEWKVAQDETGHHLAESALGPVIDGDADSRENHSHHGTDCRVCPSVSQLRQAAAAAHDFAPTAASALPVSPIPRAYSPDGERALNGARAPPAGIPA